MKKLVSEIRNNYSAILALTEANLKTSIEETRLGWLWLIINPIVMMGIYYFFVNVILQRGGENFHLFVLTGIVTWGYFSNSLLGSTKIIVNNQQLIKQVALPIPMLILIPIIVQGVIGAIGLAVIIVWNFKVLGFHTLMVFPLVILIAMLSYGVGLFVSVLNVYIGDIDHMLSYILRMGFFLSPILFPSEYVLQSERLPDFIKTLYQLNPMVEIISAFRLILLDGVMFNVLDMLILAVYFVILIQLGLIWVRRNSSQIVKML